MMRLNLSDRAPPVSLNPFLALLTSLTSPSTVLPAGKTTRSPTINALFTVALILSPTTAVSDDSGSGRLTDSDVPAGIVTTTGAGCCGTTACGRSSGMEPVDCDVRVRCGWAGAVLFRSAGGGGGGGGACSAVSRLSFFWLEQPEARMKSTATNAGTVGLRRLRFMILLSRTGRRSAVPADCRELCHHSAGPPVRATPGNFLTA